MSATLQPVASSNISVVQESHFCNGALWDLNVTWYTDRPDFTTCFHSTVLIYVPCLFLLLTMPLKLYEWRNPNANQLRNPSSKCRFVTFLRFGIQTLLIILSICGLILNMTEIWTFSTSDEYAKPISEVIAPLILSLTFVLCLNISIKDHKGGIQMSSGMQFGFWFLIMVAATFTFASVVRFPEKRSAANNIIIWIYYILVLIAFLLEFWPSPTPDYVSIGGKFYTSIYIYIYIYVPRYS